jgi:ubiquinone/menaquinone biosynthesis C-methylase UbiE
MTISQNDPFQPNPRRRAFDNIVTMWDSIPPPPNFEQKVNRIMAAGCPGSCTTLLDIGTGTGCLIPAIAEKKPKYITAVDLSRLMVSRLRNKFEKHISLTQEIDRSIIIPINADALYLPIKDGSVGTVFCNDVFAHFNDTSKTLLELYRVLKPGGRLIISHLLGREKVNHIHSHHKQEALRNDLLAPAAEVIQTLVDLDFIVHESEDTETFYFIHAEKLALAGNNDSIR